MEHLLRHSLIALAFALGVSLSACNNDSSQAGSDSRTPASSTSPRVNEGRVTLSGTARLDGTAFDSEFIGAVVLQAGLATPCDVTIPAISHGQFALEVYGAGESAGCGRPGTAVVLWTYSGDTKLYSTRSIGWPTRDAAYVTVDFSRVDPRGAAPTVLELSGAVHRADGTPVAAGARVDAYIDNTVCGIASVRSGDFDGYILHVVGPDSVPACRTDGTITFRVGGAPTMQTIANHGPPPREFDLTLR